MIENNKMLSAQKTLITPEIGGDENEWGRILNDNIDETNMMFRYVYNVFGNKDANIRLVSPAEKERLRWGSDGSWHTHGTYLEKHNIGAIETYEIDNLFK